MTTTVTRRLEWDMAHRVPLHESKCRNLHGHRYAVEVTCTRHELTPEGFVIDFGIIKEKLGAWIDQHWDHTTVYSLGDPFMAELSRINDEAGLKPWFRLDLAPTAEVLAEYLYYRADQLLEQHGVEVLKVVVYETPNCCAAYVPGTRHGASAKRGRMLKTVSGSVGVGPVNGAWPEGYEVLVLGEAAGGMLMVQYRTGAPFDYVAADVVEVFERRDPTELVVDALIDNLLKTSDEEILAEAEEDGIDAEDTKRVLLGAVEEWKRGQP